MPVLFRGLEPSSGKQQFCIELLSEAVRVGFGGRLALFHVSFPHLTSSSYWPSPLVFPYYVFLIRGPPCTCMGWTCSSEADIPLVVSLRLPLPYVILSVLFYSLASVWLFSLVNGYSARALFSMFCFTCSLTPPSIVSPLCGRYSLVTSAH